MKSTVNKDFGFKNKRMNDSVYLERRVIINHIYTIKNFLRSKGVNLPRIEVKICDRIDIKKNYWLGCATLGTCKIWIPADVLKRSDLFNIVAHEVVHAAFNVGHVKTCKLMHPEIQGITDKEALNLVLKYALKQGVR